MVRGVIRCRQELVGFEEDFDKEEAHKYCRIKVKRTLIADRAARLPRLPGLALLRAPTTPRPTCRKGDTGDMPKEMADELKRLGLL